MTIDGTLWESERAMIKVMVKRILNKHGYPPDLQEEAVKTVLAQAELLCAGVKWLVFSRRRRGPWIFPHKFNRLISVFNEAYRIVQIHTAAPSLLSRGRGRCACGRGFF